MNQTCHTLSIIIPAYNEEKTIAELLQRVLDADLGEGIDRELIVVNDCSTDSTGRIVQSFIAAHPQAPITYLVHDRNQGKGMAVRTGIQAVTGDYVVMQDADLELDPNDFARMLPHLLSGQYRVVYGSRFLAEENSHTYFSYQLGGKFLSVMTNLLYDQRITDEPTCYKMFDAGLLKSIPLDCKGFEFCPEVTAKVSRLGYKIKEVPIRYYPRSIEEGKKLRLRDGLKAIGTLLKYRFWKKTVQ
ncbi:MULTISPECIES: glycosyltransferase family 2 protein [Barnesiella]|uniref:glycosyltransferase family 2 protein n=1 Tax=Barnesiella TaxID=397864 RepID=UPI000B36F356|nr:MULTISPECIES: glycosyltransferase family 2 protein [Barnesiella]MCR8912802.1 glycosyltransferase family 2 protein [Barnesiella sp. ET7]MDM8268877.1 glycosyltransferase family 2 protein [Barnesiella viscericola]OUO97905.1 glycosyl transferase [Barnesiella sp. An22]HJB73459.1 glycosyltransferase family 2 protein [Candidatus Barnesiella merdigallinarum]